MTFIRQPCIHHLFYFFSLVASFDPTIYKLFFRIRKSDILNFITSITLLYLSILSFLLNLHDSWKIFPRLNILVLQSLHIFLHYWQNEHIFTRVLIFSTSPVVKQNCSLCLSISFCILLLMFIKPPLHSSLLHELSE